MSEPTREGSVLDLFCSNKPGLVKSVYTVPGISDHEVVVADCDIRARFTRKIPRKIHLYSKADWNKLRAKTLDFKEEFMEKYSDRSVDDNYESLKSHVNNIIDDHVPSKMSTTRFNVPWITPAIKRMCRKKQRLFNRAKRTRKPRHWDSFKSHKRDTLRALRKARWSYINNILQLSLEENDSKPFWKYVKSQRQDNIVVTTLKSKGQLHTDNTTKAEILNRQFKSVFTKEDKSTVPKLSGPAYPPISELSIEINGVVKLLSKLNPSKASGPDNIPCRILKELAVEIAPVLTAIFQQSLASGQLPTDWSKANITPVFKKGDKNLAENYRPVSLTCISCKLLEHIICSHIHKHLERHGILTPVQHGFRAMRSCETQLLVTLHDLLSLRDRKVQVDVAILDFSKAFDTVPHKRLLGKLEYYGIDGTIHKWVSAFLNNREQRVVVNGSNSRPVSVDSGVPQGTVLGPLLFLLHINDLPQMVSSQTRLFADDCLLYRPIYSRADQILMQKDLNILHDWGNTWGMRFNASKCYIMRISRARETITQFYTLGGPVLAEVQNSKYLGLNISNELDWSTHIADTTRKGNCTLGFIRRNLKSCPGKLKETAYLSLVRSVLEYGATIWDPYLAKDINSLEMDQRKAARFVKHDYRRTSSVTAMLADLGWKNLADRRRDLRLALLYKITNNLVAVPASSIDINKPYSTRTRAKHKHKYQTLRANTNELKHSFVHRTIPEWNILPAYVAEADSVSSFKARLAKPAGPSD